MSADFRIARYELPDPAAGKNLSLHINETTVSFPLEASKAQEITSALNELLQTFKDKQAAERPKRWKPMEFRHKGALATPLRRSPLCLLSGASFFAADLEGQRALIDWTARMSWFAVVSSMMWLQKALHHHCSDAAKAPHAHAMRCLALKHAIGVQGMGMVNWHCWSSSAIPTLTRQHLTQRFWSP